MPLKTPANREMLELALNFLALEKGTDPDPSCLAGRWRLVWFGPTIAQVQSVTVSSRGNLLSIG